MSLPYLFWREGIVPGTFGIHQIDNDMVAWMAHAQELRDHHRTILGLESELIHANARADHFEAVFAREREEKDRLLRRRTVRLALGLAGLAKPVFRRLSS